MRITSQDLYNKLLTEYKIVGQTGKITFTLKDICVQIENKDAVGNLIQEWLKEWLKRSGITFQSNPSSQTFPDYFLNPEDYKNDLMEVKSFDIERGPGFDIANFDSYCKSITTDAYRINSDYLIFAYEMRNGEITIKNIWLKKIWEISGPSSTYPLKVQEKKNVIYNIRPVIWYSQKAKFKPFNSKEDFIRALNETRYQYPKTHHLNAHWLNDVKRNYQEHTRQSLY